MDSRTESAVEATLQHNLLHNEYVAEHPVFGAVRLARPTLSIEKAVAEYRRKQFTQDMKDPEVLSRDQLEKIAIERGMWTPGMTEKVKELTGKTGEVVGLLEAIGFKSVDEIYDEFQDTIQKLLLQFPDPEDPDEMNKAVETRQAIHRYFSLEGKPERADRKLIIERAPSTVVDDLMDEGTAQRTQLDLLTEMIKLRQELDSLQSKQAKLFMDSVEARADRAEELAVVYHCATSVATGKPLWPTIEDMRNAPIEDVEWVISEYQYFRHGVTEEMKEKLGKYGFIKRLTVTSDSSGDSPDQPTSNSDGVLPESEPTSSSEATA